MPKYVLALAVLALSLTVVHSTAHCQTGPAVKRAADAAALPPEAPTRDQVMTLLDQLQVRRNMAVALDSMKQLMRQSTEEAFRRKHPNPTAKELQQLHGLIDDAMGDIRLDDLIGAIIPIYQRHLTKTDLAELVRFYGSPVGQKLIHEQPAIMQESMQAGADIQRKRMDEIMAKIEQRVQDMQTEQTEPSK